jgi:hypothetical protein
MCGQKRELTRDSLAGNIHRLRGSTELPAGGIDSCAGNIGSSQIGLAEGRYVLFSRAVMRHPLITN